MMYLQAALAMCVCGLVATGCGAAPDEVVDTDTVEVIDSDIADTDTTSCQPDCDDKACGDDGCGGSCGGCGGAEVCTDAGQCHCGLLRTACPSTYTCLPGEQTGWDYCYGGGFDSVYVPPGVTVMGCDPVRDGESDCPASQRPQHEVVVPGFAILITELAEIDHGEGCHDEFQPASCLSQADAASTCDGLGDGWRLCTEAEWEKAARGGCETVGAPDGGAACAAATRAYPWGDAAPTCDLAWMDDGSGVGCGTDALGDIDSKSAGSSPYGVLNMAGNVAEWVQDCWHTSYTGAPSADGSVAWTEACDDSSAGVVRGGTYASDAMGVRTTARAPAPAASDAADDIGVRCCRAVP